VRIFVGSLLIFFGTMLMAGLVELGRRGGDAVVLLPDAASVRASQGQDHSSWAMLAAALGWR
jgi:hypothetical protein